MNAKYLAVDSDVKLADSEAAAWARRGIGMERADNMTDAIKRLLSPNIYLYVGINADAVEFMPMLNMMRSVTFTPILIATGSFTTHTEVEALHNGADLYARWHPTPEDNMASVMAHVERASKREMAQIRAPRILACGNLLVFTDYKMVFCGDKEIMFTAKEYGILAYLLNHINITLSIGQIAQEVWGGAGVSQGAVRKNIDLLRKRLRDAGFVGGVITNYRGMGYRLATTL